MWASVCEYIAGRRSTPQECAAHGKRFIHGMIFYVQSDSPDRWLNLPPCPTKITTSSGNLAPIYMLNATAARGRDIAVPA